MKKYFSCFSIFVIILCVFSTGAMANKELYDKNLLILFQTFHNAIKIEDINDITYGVIVNNIDNRCADIDYNDLKAWLNVYWNFNYDLVIAPLEAFELTGNYVKLFNKDRTKSFVVYPNGAVIAGKFGKSYYSHGVNKQNYVWYMPVMGNSRNALNTANGTLEHIYFYKNYEGYKNRERLLQQEDKINIPENNLLLTDDASEWARSEIEKAAACNLLIYNLTDKYTQPITRYEFCRLVYRLIATEFEPNSDSRLGIEMVMQDIVNQKGLTGVYNTRFTDCNYTEVNVLASMGIIEGMGHAAFEPESFITREQAAVILYRVAEFLGNKNIIQPQNTTYYDDEPAISDWAVNSVKRMNEMGIMKGISKDCFMPRGLYTVEQAAATMVRLYECN